MVNMRIFFSKKSNLILIAVLFLGLFLRICLIDKNSFWEDEAATATAVKNYGTLEILRNSLVYGNVTPGYFQGIAVDLPFYFVLLSFWVKLFNVSELSLRLFSALFGSLSILMIFLVAKELAGRKTALLSSFIFSLSMINIQFSQEARQYSLLTFIALLSTYFFIKFFKAGKSFHLAIFAALTAMGLYTHFPYVFFVAFQVAFILVMVKLDFRYREHIKKIIAAFLLICLFYLPMLPRLFAQQTGAGAFIGKPTPISTAKVWIMLNTWIYPSAELQSNIYSMNLFQIAFYDWLLIISALLLVLLMSAFFALAVLSSKSGKLFKIRHFKNQWLLLLIFWFFIPFLLEFLLSVLHPTATLFGPISYLLFIFPAYIILVSIGILHLKQKYSTIAIILLVLFSLLPLASYYTNINKQQWREVAMFMKENIGHGEAILLNSPYMEVAFDYYYGDYNGLYPVHNAAQAGEASKNRDSLWLMLSFDKYFDPQGEIRNYLEKEYKIDREEDFFDIKVLHYSRRFSKP